MNNHIYAGDVEKDIYYQSEESKPEFEESTAERTKMRRQIESDEKKGQRLKMLASNQKVTRLPITLSQLKAGNNSETLN